MIIKVSLKNKLKNIWRSTKLYNQSTKTIKKKKIHQLYVDSRIYQRSRRKTGTNFFFSLFQQILSYIQRKFASDHKNISLFTLPVNDIAERLKNLQLANKS